MWLKRQDPTKFTPCSALMVVTPPGRAAVPLPAASPVRTASPVATSTAPARIGRPYRRSVRGVFGLRRDQRSLGEHDRREDARERTGQSDGRNDALHEQQNDHDRDGAELQRDAEDSRSADRHGSGADQRRRRAPASAPPGARANRREYPSSRRASLSRSGGDRFSRGLELLRSQTDVRVASEAAREDAGGLHRRCVAEPLDRDEWPDRDPPAPAFAARVVLRVADDLDHREDVLPARRVANRQIAALQARALG